MQIERQSLSLQLFHTIVLDECHHASGGHAYSNIMKMLHTLPEKKRPRFLGLSASPFKVENDTKGRNEMLKFMKNFPGTILCRPKCINAVEMPDIIWHPIYPSNTETTFLRLLYRDLKVNCNKYGLLLDPNWIENEESIKRYLHQIQGALRNHYHMYSSSEILNTLTMAASVEIAQVLGINIAKKILRENISNGFPDWLSNDYDDSKSDRLLHLEKEIEMMINDKSSDSAGESRMLILTSTRECARLLKNHLMEYYPKLNPAYIVGKNGASGMNWDEQKCKLVAFNAGICKLLVATSVLEEGLDVSECNRVVLFSGHVNLIRFIQSRGRARKTKSRFIVLSDGNGDRLDKILQREEIMYRLIDRENNCALYQETLIKVSQIKWIYENYVQDESVNQAIEERKSDIPSPCRTGEMSTIIILEKRSLHSKRELEENLVNSIENTGLFDVKRLLEESNAMKIRGLGNVFSKEALFYLLTIEDFKEGSRTAMDIFIDLCQKWTFRLSNWNTTVYCAIPELHVDVQYSKVQKLACFVSFGRMRELTHFELSCSLQHKFVLKFEGKGNLILDSCDEKLNSGNLGEDHNYLLTVFNVIKINAIGNLGFGFVSIKESSVSVYLHLTNTPKFFIKEATDEIKRAFLKEPDRDHIGESDFIKIKFLATGSERNTILNYLSANLTYELFVSDFSQGKGQSFKKGGYYDFEINWRQNILISSRNVMITNSFEDLVYKYYKEECLQSRGLGPYHTITDSLDHILTSRNFLEDLEDQFYASYRSEKRSHTDFPSDLKDPPYNWMYIKRLVITPSRYIYFPATLIKKSRLFRKYSDKKFVNVSFRDEDLSRLNDLPVIKPIEDIITEGLKLCGETYHFLNASSSQLREGKALFVSSESYNDVYLMRNDILNLDEQSKSFQSPAKYMSRIGLYSTSDIPLCNIAPASISNINDIHAENGALLTDGAGKIKYSLLKELGYKHASSIQFRHGGSKGILVSVRATWYNS